MNKDKSISTIPKFKFNILPLNKNIKIELIKLPNEMSEFATLVLKDNMKMKDESGLGQLSDYVKWSN